MPVKVLVIDDSPYHRTTLCEILESIPGVEVAATAADGVQGLRLAFKLSPDLITLDIEMPNMDGFTFLRLLSGKGRSTPVIVISRKRWEENALRAIEFGAFDFIEKPAAHPSRIFALKSELARKVRLFGCMRPKEGQDTVGIHPATLGGAFPQAVAIGASTGGPKAVSSIIKMIPGGYASAFLVSLHIPEWLTRPFAERLNAQAKLPVSVAQDGEPVAKGRVLVAPGGHHMFFERKGGAVHTRIARMKAGDPHAPSIDTMFTSAADVWGASLVGIILTGLGSDGRSGVINIKENGGYCMAESRESAAAFSMPEAAISTGKVDRVLPVLEIGAWLLNGHTAGAFKFIEKSDAFMV